MFFDEITVSSVFGKEILWRIDGGFWFHETCCGLIMMLQTLLEGSEYRHTHFVNPRCLSESLALCMAYNWQASNVAANEIAIFTVRHRGGRRLTTHLITGNKQSKIEDTLKRKDKRRDTFVDRWQQISTGNVNEFSEPLEISSSSKLAGPLSSYF